MPITMGAPKTEVTVLMLSSVGAKAVRAMRSQPMQNTAPPRKAAGMTTSGLDVFSPRLTRWGTAMPTKEMGPAKAVTQAEKQAKNTVRFSQGGRLLMQGAVLVLAAVLPHVFNIWAAAIPLLIPRIAVSFRQLKLAKENPSPDRPAIGYDDEDGDE